MSADDLRVVDPLGADALALLRAAALEVRALYSDPIAEDAPLPTHALHAAGCVYLVAHGGGRPAGMGALPPVPARADEAAAADTAKVRRTSVDAAYRRRGVGRGVAAALGRHAATTGYCRRVLETGKRQAPAIALYEAGGVRPIEAFGPCVEDPLSRCFEALRVAGEASRADAQLRGRTP